MQPALANVVRKIESIAGGAGGSFSVYAINLGTGERIALNEKKPYPSASLIKVPILVELLRQSCRGEIDLESRVRVSGMYQENETGILVHLTGCPEFTVRDLALLMIVLSDNAAANILIDLVGMEAVNATMRSLGLSSTILARKLCDWTAQKAGRENLCTAEDMVNLLAKLARREALPPPACDEAVKILLSQQQKDKLALMLPEDVKVASKDGELSNVDHTAGIVWTDSLSYAICILSKDTRDRASRKLAISTISKAIFDHWSRSA